LGEKMNFLKSILFTTIFVALVLFFQNLMTPKYMSHTFEGAMIAEYYSAQHPHDVIFIGDCEIYHSFSPIVLWEEFGITSYIRGGPHQLVWQSYYILEDTLRRETPAVVVFNVLAMQHPEPVSEGYNRLNIDGLPLSRTKLNAINTSMMEDESIFSYILPIIRWHTRWNDLSEEDFRYMFNRRRVTHNGYMLRADISPAGALPTKRALADYSFGDKPLEYLDRIVELCKAHDISLILVKSPALFPFWHDQWDAKMQTYADDNDLRYLNLHALSEVIGIDMYTDTFNGGLHLNVYGAEKTAHYVGRILSEEFGLTGHKDDPVISAAWEEKSLAYYTMKAQQQAEFEEYGQIFTFTF